MSPRETEEEGSDDNDENEVEGIDADVDDLACCCRWCRWGAALCLNSSSSTESGTREPLAADAAATSERGARTVEDGADGGRWDCDDDDEEETNSRNNWGLVKRYRGARR